MKELFVIDGTNLINVLSADSTPDARKIDTFLQLLLELVNREDNFFCYFDASTRFMFEDGSLDRQLYDILIGLRISDYFEQVPGGVSADKLILKQADETNSRVISMDTFGQFAEEFSWTEQDSDFRLIPADVIQHQLRVDKLGIKTPVVLGKAQEMALELINRLEAERGNLAGSIKKYDTARRFGLIERVKGGPTLLFHKRQVVDENLDFTVTGQPVKFQIDFRYNKSKDMIDFCATDIAYDEKLPEVVAEIDSEELKRLREENEALKEMAAGLRKRNRELNNTVHSLEVDVSNLEQVVEVRDERITELEAELEALKAQQRAAQKAFEQNLETLHEERNELVLTVDLQTQKIQNLDADLKEMLHLFKNNKIDPTEVILYEKLKQNYKLLQYSIRQKEARIAFLRNNIQALHDELDGTKIGGNAAATEQLYKKVRELEQTNLTLQRQLQTLQNAAVVTPEPPAIVRETPKNYTTTTEKIDDADLKNWWFSLTDAWRSAFNKAILGDRESFEMPSFEELWQILRTTDLEIIGERLIFGGFNRLNFRLTDFSGLTELRLIEHLNLSGHDFEKLEGFDSLTQLKTINLTINRIRNIGQSSAFKNVKTLILRDNLLQNLDGIEQFEALHYLDISSNESLTDLKPLDGLEHLKSLQVGYAPHLKRQIIRFKMMNPSVKVVE